MKKILIGLSLLTAVVAAGAQTPVAPFHKGDRVAFVGNSITDGGHYHSYIWLYYMTRFPDQRIDIFNAGIGGDVAEQIYRRFDTDVLQHKPTVISLTFGMNDTKYFEYLKPHPEADTLISQAMATSFASFRKIEKKLQALTGVKKIMMVSSPYDETVKFKSGYYPGKSVSMLKVAAFQQQAAQANGWGFVDLNRPMTAINQREQQRDSLFTLCGGDRIHPGLDGHMVMAYVYLKAQGLAGKPVALVTIDAAGKKTEQAGNCTISNLSVTPAGIAFNYLANALPYPTDTTVRGWGVTTRQSDALKYVPFTDEFNREMLTVKNLDANKQYRLSIDGQEIHSFSGAELSKGVNLAEYTNTPQYQQAQAVQFLNEDRWELERRLRMYAWTEYDVLYEHNLLFKDDLATLDTLNNLSASNGWIKGNLDMYKRLRLKESRDALHQEMETLISTIYTINRPKNRRVTLTAEK